MLCVCVCAGFHVFFVHNLISFSLVEKCHPYVFKKKTKNTGFVVAPLKKVKSLSRREQSVEAHKYSCGRATDGSFFIEPRFETECLSRFLKHLVPPNGKAPSTTSPVTLSICTGPELRGSIPRESCWVT